MTYCVGVLVRDGLVLVADTRTNAGIDNISVYKKLHTLVDTEERQVFACTSGSLSITQAMLSHLEEGLPGQDDSGVARTIGAQPTMFRIAQLVGEALTLARGPIRATLEGTRISASASVLVGGRIGEEPLALFQVYAEGNFIECQPDAPFLQIGEVKYGKPILDRALTFDTSLEEAVKVALISFDSTMRSNLSVGRPLDVVAMPADRARPAVCVRLAENDPYFNQLSADWGRKMTESRLAIADPPFMLPQIAPERSELPAVGSAG